MREFCNLAYAQLAEGRDRAQLAELQAALAPPEQQREIFDKVNAQSMASLGMGPLIPVPTNNN
jgi:hypothetical protein